MCINAIKTSVASFCVRNMPFPIIITKSFNLPLETWYTFGTHLDFYVRSN